MTSGFDRTLVTLKNEMKEVIRELKGIDVALDPDGEGTVRMPVSLFFQVMGIMTWLAEEEATDG